MILFSVDKRLENAATSVERIYCGSATKERVTSKMQRPFLN